MITRQASTLLGILGLPGVAAALLLFSPGKDFQAGKPENHPPGRPWKVLVVEKETGRPVPGAEVLVLDLAEAKDPQRSYWKTRFLSRFTQEEPAREFRRAFRADARGVAWIPVFDPMLLLSMEARKGNLWGNVPSLSLSGPPFRIEVTPFKEIRVQVKDQEGRPVAGVPVGLGLRLNPSFRFFPMRALTRGPEGIAHFLHTNVFLQQRGKRAKGLAALLVPLKEPLVKEFDPRNPPSEPIVLTLPPAGKVRLLVKGTKGPIPGEWCLAALLPKGEKKGEPRAVSMRPVPILPVKEGRALFPYVGLGLELKALVTASRVNFPFFRFGCGMGEWAFTRGPGPARPGETVDLQVTLRTPTLLTGRILLPSGDPASGKIFLFHHKVKGKLLSTGNRTTILRTDREGRFQLRLPSGGYKGTSRTLEWILLSRTRWAPLAARRDLGKDLPPGELRLGDIRLSIRPLLAEGEVTDTRGRPVPWARIEIGAGKKHGGFFLPASYHGLSGGQSNENGHFRIFGPPPYKDMFIRASKPGWVAAGQVRLCPGVRGIRLILERAGKVAAHFLADPGISLEGFPVSLVYSGRRKRIAQEEIHEDRVVFEDMPPGNADLEVFLLRPHGSQQHPGQEDRSKAYLLAEIPDIRVESGKTTKDPRLERIDLRGKIRILELDLRDPKGNPILEGSLRWGPRFENWEWFFSKDPIFLPANAPAALWVGAPGFRPKRIAPRPGKTRVVLEKGIPVELVYTGKAPLPPRPVLLGVKLKPLYRREENPKEEKKEIPLVHTGPPLVLRKGEEDPSHPPGARNLRSQLGPSGGRRSPVSCKDHL